MSFIDREYLQNLREAPRKECIEGWLRYCELNVITEARQGNSQCKYDFRFYELGPQLKNGVRQKIENKYKIKPDELLMALIKKFKNCNITFDMEYTFTIDWS
jgi:hypothetical protein